MLLQYFYDKLILFIVFCLVRFIFCFLGMCCCVARSSSGQGSGPLEPLTRVRISSGLPLFLRSLVSTRCIFSGAKSIRFCLLIIVYFGVFLVLIRPVFYID